MTGDTMGGREPLSRQDWIDTAMQMLTEQGVEAVKVMRLAQHLGVARSSFYWHFDDRRQLLAELLDRWRVRNTASIVRRAQRTTRSPQEAVLAVFEAWMAPDLFDPQLDFAVRAWARRDEGVAAEFADATRRRVAALAEMFVRHGYPTGEATTRARVVYFTQVAYYELADPEPLAVRLVNAPRYVQVFTGERPTDDEMSTFASFCNAARFEQAHERAPVRDHVAS